MSGVKNLNLAPRLCENLEGAGLVSAHSLVVLSEPELRKVANLSQEECETVYVKASEAILTPGFITSLDAARVLTGRWQHLSVGCPRLDRFLGGGVATRGVTELAGESGSGKTQLCLQMCLSVQRPREAGGLAAGGSEEVPASAAAPAHGQAPSGAGRRRLHRGGLPCRLRPAGRGEPREGTASGGRAAAPPGGELPRGGDVRESGEHRGELQPDGGLSGPGVGEHGHHPAADVPHRGARHPRRLLAGGAVATGGLLPRPAAGLVRLRGHRGRRHSCVTGSLPCETRLQPRCEISGHDESINHRCKKL
ncbi:uncharacterized protein LOC134528327 isoform X2 [Bacillus rossius redtenbacheri]|uniref:uncharacterized protein LOC134528327 isoform X2 n=1 Tax=Bacillus rossius redtenbacheri TaxID=93214 RepID=UPI002FDCDEFC